MPTHISYGKKVRYALVQVSKEELFARRLSKQPGIVYKYNGMLFYAAVKNHMEIFIQGKPHLCALHCSRVCKDCPRTRDLTVAYQLKFNNHFFAAVKDSWRIEKYPFIQEGIEAFNLPKFHDTHYVCSCSKYSMYDLKKPLTPSEINEKKKNLALLYFYDFK